jgi:predicted metalloprotease with PDZ domain
MDYRAAKPSAGPWFSECLSIFYADLLLRRAGLWASTPTRMAHLEELIARYLGEPGNTRGLQRQHAPAGGVAGRDAGSCHPRRNEQSALHG